MYSYNIIYDNLLGNHGRTATATNYSMAEDIYRTLNIRVMMENITNCNIQ